MLKEPKAGEWWVDRDEDDYIVLVVGFDHSEDPVTEDKWDDLDAYEMATFLKKFKYEPDCDGFDWVKPEPEVFPQYLIHPRGFFGDTAYLLRTSKDCYECIGKDGKSQSVNTWVGCDTYVREGHWLQVTQAEAEALLDKPVPIESPDDWVTQDVVVPRNNIDEWAWVIEGKIPRESQWERGNGNFKYTKHGDKLFNEILHVRCRRKDFPKPPEPAKTRVELRLWVHRFTGEIVHDGSSVEDTDWLEVLFDSTGQMYYLKD